MYTLFIGNKNYSSWSLRPWLLMQQLGIEFEERLVPFTDGGSWAQFRNFSPTGLVPCLHHGDQVIWESLGIVEYLAERHDDVWPQHAEARTWARCATAEMHSGFVQLRNQCPMTVGLRIRLHHMDTGLQRDMTRLQELWEQGLTRFGGPFLAGETFTAVDAFYAPVVFRLQTFGLPLSDACRAYKDRMLALPGMQAWQADALTEPHRELSHEAEFAELGQILEDLRR